MINLNRYTKDELELLSLFAVITPAALRSMVGDYNVKRLLVASKSNSVMELVSRFIDGSIYDYIDNGTDIETVIKTEKVISYIAGDKKCYNFDPKRYKYYIDNALLDNRTKNALSRHGFTSIHQLKNHSLVDIRGIGNKTRMQIKNYLKTVEDKNTKLESDLVIDSYVESKRMMPVRVAIGKILESIKYRQYINMTCNGQPVMLMETDNPTIPLKLEYGISMNRSQLLELCNKEYQPLSYIDNEGTLVKGVLVDIIGIELVISFI